MNGTTMQEVPVRPKVLMGLGNPEARFNHTRHNIGFAIIDALAASVGGQWHQKGPLEIASISLNSYQLLLVKPQTYMNNSGDAVPFLKKQGFTPSEVLVIHDELELPFGKLAFKQGGSAKGHNGLKSLIERWGTDVFPRFRYGIGRPAHREQVPDYVLQKFEDPHKAQSLIDESVALIEQLYE